MDLLVKSRFAARIWTYIPTHSETPSWIEESCSKRRKASRDWKHATHLPQRINSTIKHQSNNTKSNKQRPGSSTRKSFSRSHKEASAYVKVRPSRLRVTRDPFRSRQGVPIAPPIAIICKCLASSFLESGDFAMLVIALSMS